MPRRRRARTTRGPDRQPRTMSPASLANLKPIDVVQDGKTSVATRIRLSPADLRMWRRMDPEERSRVVEMGLRARENGG